MEEDVGAKAPVIRLRRRLSVESDDVKSPSGATTPTKKRGGRLVAKPQLDLIVEAIENIPKRSTRKTAAKDISIDPGDEVPVTPSRRSARIRSNTSIVAETTQSYDSPRAKRAARRTSQAGSDNETPLAPSRQTRRTRKDSASSIDNQDDITSSNKIIEVADVIVEETEASDDVKNITPVRKSPRISQKKNKKRNSTTPEDKSNELCDKDDKPMDEPTNKDTSKTSDEIIQSIEPVVILSPINVGISKDTTMEMKNIDQENFSSDNSSDKLIIDLDRKPKKNYSVINKSTSALEDTNSSKNKRHRTKSWSIISVPNTKEDKFFSDNEVKKKKNNDESLSLFDMGSGDGIFNKLKLSKNKANKVDKENENSLNLSNTNKNDNSITATADESNNKLVKHNKPLMEASKTIPKSDENIEETSQISQINPVLNSVTKLLQKAPSDNIQSIVLLEDSDSNTGSSSNIKQHKQYDGEDQCVPVVVQHMRIEEPDLVNSNDSYEPMDVDETIPQNTSITDFSKKKSFSKLDENVSEQNASIYTPTEKVNCNETPNKSKRKSSVTDSESQNLQKSSNENKSTLILSQIKDTTCNESNADSKSPKVTTINEQQSQSIIISDTAQDKERYNKNVSLNYLTSTPLQQKPNKNIGMQIDTSIISPKNVNNKETKQPKNTSNQSENSPARRVLSDDKKLNKSLQEKSQINDEHEAESSTDETSKEQSNLIDDEAEEASADYESGDSQDYEERQYEKENEIVDKGETLETDDDYTDNTDYEKDSFIVSSNEEDQELLSGSGDDLSMSDNELTMSAKSKKKFNDRKVKEQRKASREMYQARHKLNDSDKSPKSGKSKTKKNKRQRLDSSSSSNSDRDTAEQPKKNNRLRIDSSQDTSNSKSDADESLTKKKKKSKRLSESTNNAMNENEITILNESADEKVNPLAMLVKQEPKTPQKDLNISTVLITDNLEEVKIDENVSISKTNETSDPLQNTIANDESDSSSSGNEEIIDNYDSMLNELNCKQIKSRDISLNLNKKEKRVNEPIFDQLNLTKPKAKKSQKKLKNKTIDDANDTEVSQDVQALNKPTINSDDEAASDSIDMRLLFPEDSNESDAIDKKETKENTVDSLQDFIPLKKSEAQTNIRASMDTTSENHDTSVQNLSNSSKKKNKKRESSQYIPEEITSTNNEEETSDVNFFMDTTGTRVDASIDTSLSTSGKKKKNNKNNSATVEVAEETVTEILYSSEKKRRKSKQSLNNSNSELIYADKLQDVAIPGQNTMTISENALKNNKKRMSLNNSHSDIGIQIATDEHEDANNANFIIDTVGAQIELDASIDTSQTNSAKKKKKKNKMENLAEELPVDISYTSDKKETKTKRSLDNTNSNAKIYAAEIPLENTVTTSEKLKNNKKGMTQNNSYSELEIQNATGDHEDSNNANFVIDTVGSQLESNASIDTSQSNSAKKKKKKKKKNKAQILTEELPVDIPYSSEKKSNESKQSLDDNTQNEAETNVDKLDKSQPIEHENIELTSSGKKKKKNKKGKLSQNNTHNELEMRNSVTEDIESDEAPLEISYISDKKNKKDKPMNNDSSQIDIQTQMGLTVSEDAPHEISYRTEKKKHKKMSQSQDIIDTENNAVQEEVNVGTSSKKRKRKASTNSVNEVVPTGDKLNASNNSKSFNESLSNGSKKKKLKLTDEIENVTDQGQEMRKKKNKKRKERDDDEPAKISKVFKENSLDKIHVPRLPSHILNQLDDKPKQVIVEKKNNQAISTSNFSVETAKIRRNKPSNYLEESVYLNDSAVTKKQKKSLKKPKVLPFIPTASTSDSGFTTNFRINILSRETQYIAQPNDIINFKNDILQQHKLKRLDSLGKYKTKNKNRDKINKF